MRRTQAEQTTNGDYEFITYHTFEAVDYNRYMSWKAGSGLIGVGLIQVKSQKTDKDTEDELLPAGQGVVVSDTNFKLKK